ncbi:response regulator [Persicimonas caeni]|uniref:Response regulator n=1 Tax=Persicimonas caeni TaxID=2292766 RepID=A0A4Y6PSQ3_PERCE|nr:response regulator transcription factor [Persicimonas caeni]QDG51037.1 response regulator [Persicimonas caeni]QED32258.1 response regulator [Persicimonas caeni]
MAEQSPQRTKLLVVDDDPLVRDAVTIMLSVGPKKFDITAVGDSQTALQAVRQHPFGVALIDVVMPEMTGAELAGRLRQEQSDLPVVYVSGYASNAVRDHGVQSDDIFVQKPYTPDQLIAAIKLALNGEARS